MTTATTNPRPDVAPPPGAAFVDDWQPEQYRIVYGSRREISGEVEVSASVAQLADGTINGSSGEYDPPLVHVHTTGAFGLTTEQARELAGAILDAVNELDGWARDE
ncbi:MAG TPA: hypothetical protein VFW69_04295 [Mycobacterium sp.]|nr:hypothetical protein [Mycobacterium sp.]